MVQIPALFVVVAQGGFLVLGPHCLARILFRGIRGTVCHAMVQRIKSIRVDGSRASVCAGCTPPRKGMDLPGMKRLRMHFRMPQYATVVFLSRFVLSRAAALALPELHDEVT